MLQWGQFITPESKERIESIINKGVEEGAELLLDGRATRIKDFEGGFFLKPTVLGNIKPGSEIHKTEIFGPVLGLMHTNTLDDAIEHVNSGEYGNAASIFTRNGAAARKFRHDVLAGNIGVNIGIAAPMAQFPFSGWKNSSFGDLHGQSRHAVDYYTQTKVVVERWHDED